MSAGDTGGDSPAHGREERLRRTLLRYWTPLWLLGLAVLLGALAFALYPSATHQCRPSMLAAGHRRRGHLHPERHRGVPDAGSADRRFHPVGRPACQGPGPPVQRVGEYQPAAREPGEPRGTCRPPAQSSHRPHDWAQGGPVRPSPCRGRMPGATSSAAAGYQLHLSITVSHVGSNLSREQRIRLRAHATDPILIEPAETQSGLQYGIRRMGARPGERVLVDDRGRAGLRERVRTLVGRVCHVD